MSTFARPKFGTPAALTITLADGTNGLASGQARQSTLVDNSTTRYDIIHLFCKVTVGLTTNNPALKAGSIRLHELRGDGTRRTDGAGAADADIVIATAPRIALVRVPATSSTVREFYARIVHPGLEWGVALEHNTGDELDPTAANHSIFWYGEHMEHEDQGA